MTICDYNETTLACTLVNNAVGSLQPPKKKECKIKIAKSSTNRFKKRILSLCNRPLECPDRGSDDDASQTRQGHVEAYGFQPQIGNRHDIT